MKSNLYLVLMLLAILYSTNSLSNTTKIYRDTVTCDTTIIAGIISPNTDQSVYTAMQNIWYANEKISYLGMVILPQAFKPKYLEDINIPLRDGEGVNGYIFEGNIYHQTPIMMGRNHGRHFWQTSRLTFDYGFNVRMARDGSSPLVPNNNIFGFTIDKILWNSVSGKKLIYADPELPFQNWEKREESLSTLSLNVTAHHYSNGQREGFFHRDTVNNIPKRRNDYLKGDFSTNYLQTGLTYSYLSKARDLYSVKLAYQRDGNVFGPLRFSKEQDSTGYGRNRILGFFQFRKLFQKLKADTAYAVQKVGSKESIIEIQPYRNAELIARFEYEYIMGNMNNYPHQNKYRFNSSFFIKYTQQNWRALGIVARIHYGRDYANIRYDLPVFMALAGISVDFNKFFIPLTQKRRFSIL